MWIAANPLGEECQAFKVGRCWQLLKGVDYQADTVQELVLNLEWLVFIPAEERFFPMLASEQPVSSSGVARQIITQRSQCLVKCLLGLGLTLALCKPGYLRTRREKNLQQVW